METINVKITINSSLDLVWLAWTQANRITEWFSPEANVEARVGGPFELFFDTKNHNHQSTIGCVFTQVESKNKLCFTWKGPNQFAEFMNHTSSLTSVTVLFSEDDKKIHLNLIHDGWGTGEKWEKAKAWHQEQWQLLLKNLKSVIESDT